LVLVSVRSHRTRALSDEALLEVAGFDATWVEDGVEVRRLVRDAMGIAMSVVIAIMAR
jgi:hypothetical protein